MSRRISASFFILALGVAACDAVEESSIVVDASAERAGAGVSEPDFRAPVAGAPAGVDETVAAGAAAAELVFVGEVVRIDHATSAPGADALEIPHTFVTYAVERGLKGADGGGEVTLRFAGGPAQRGTYLHVSGLPRFQIGDRDLLLVQDNGRSACPLVECSRGRFRLVDGGVYTDGGRELVVDGDDRVRIGMLDDRAALTVSDDGERRVQRRTVVDERLELQRAGLGEAVSEQAFADRVQRAVERAPAARTAFRSADPRAAFTIPAGRLGEGAPPQDRGAPLPAPHNPPLPKR